jgi:hypothetical protein
MYRVGASHSMVSRIPASGKRARVRSLARR